MTEVETLRAAVQQLQQENEQLVNLRRVRTSMRTAEVVEGIAVFVARAEAGDQQALGNLRALIQTLDRARALAGGIVLPNSTNGHQLQ